MNEEDIELNLTLNVNEINLVLNSLGRPIEAVNNLIQKIKQQGEEQIAQMAQAQAQAQEEPEQEYTEQVVPASKPVGGYI